MPVATVDLGGLPAMAGLEVGLVKGAWGPLPKGYALVPGAPADSAADLVNRGFYQIQLFNSPDAARHFLAALEMDRERGLAWAGLYLAMLERGEEMQGVREECHLRANLLKGAASPREKAWIEAVGVLHLQGTQAFATALEAIRDKWPADLNAQVLAPMLRRDGFDGAGAPKAGQQAAEATVRRLRERRTNDPVVLHAFLQTVLVGPKPEDGLAAARALLALDPPSAYYRQVAGQVLYRCGEAAAAAAAFNAARTFDEGRLKEAGISSAAAPTYFDNLHCLAMAWVEAGQRDTAVAMARSARELVLPWGVHKSPAVREYAFFTSTLESLVRARCGQWAEALAAMPDPQHPVFQNGHPAAFFAEGLRAVLEGRLEAAAGRKEGARKRLLKLQRTIAAMEQATPDAQAKGMEPQWSEACRILDFLELDLRATASFVEGDRSMAALWWDSAAAREPVLRVRAVPRWPQGAAEAMADAFEKGGDLDTALRKWEEAVVQHPGSGWALAGLARVCDAQGDNERAEKTRRALKAAWARADPDLRGAAGAAKRQGKGGGEP